MSFVASSLSILQSSTRTVPVFFLILWLFTGLCLSSHSLILKNRIKQQRMGDVESALGSYLRQNSSSAGFHLSLQNNPPDTIDFIRLTSGKDQLLITGKSGMVFTGLVDLDPMAHGAWINLSQPAESGDWLLFSQTLADGSVAQAGRDDSSRGLAIYKRSVSSSWLIFVLAILPCLGLAFLFRHIMRDPLKKLSADIKHALEQKRATFHVAPRQDKDLKPLYLLLEQTFSQNRQLIVEMQSSLDNVAHDLRTPMTRLRAVAEYALQSAEDDTQLYRGALSDCLEESERVLSMLKIMMSVAEAESGTMQLHRERINLMEMLDDVIGLYQYVAEEEQITVSCNTNDTTISIFADKTRISQVWANLLDNAIKYSHESGTVTISTKSVAEYAVIRFCDDGMGISETEINRIWDRLYRGDRSRTKHGLGLGLNYVKAVVEAHGGKVVVTSTIREGSCFEVRLPTISLATPAGKAEITN